MANPTMTLIGSPIVVGSGGASSVTFSSIPATYTDLVVKCSIRSTGGTSQDYISFTFNGSGGTAYSDKRLEGYGSSTGSASDSSAAAVYAYLANGNTSTTSTFSNAEIYIPNYTSANYKSFSIDGVTENNATAALDSLVTGLWSNTSAVTSISIICGNGNVAQYSTFYLYGIASS